MNQIEVNLGKKQLISDTRINMAFETAFHEPLVSLRRRNNQVQIYTQIPLTKYRIHCFGECLGLKGKKITEELAVIS